MLEPASELWPGENRRDFVGEIARRGEGGAVGSGPAKHKGGWAPDLEQPAGGSIETKRDRRHGRPRRSRERGMQAMGSEGYLQVGVRI